MMQNMGFGIRRWNINTFWTVKLVNGKEVPCKFAYNISRKVYANDVKIKLVDRKVKIRNVCPDEKTIYLIAMIDDNKEVLKQEITLLHH